MKELLIVLCAVAAFYFVVVSLHHIVDPVAQAVTGGLN